MGSGPTPPGHPGMTFVCGVLFTQGGQLDWRCKGRIPRHRIPQRCRTEGVAGKAAQRSGARAGSADHRPAPSFLGHAAARTLPVARAAGRHRGQLGLRERPQYRLDCLPRMPLDVPQGRPRRDGAGRRGRVRQRHRGDERLGRLWPVPRRRGDRRSRRPDPWRTGARGAGSRAQGRRWAFPRHPPRGVMGRQRGYSEIRHSRGAVTPGARNQIPRGLRPARTLGAQL